MTNQEILELMARFDASSLTSFKLHSKDADLEMGKGIPAAPGRKGTGGLYFLPKTP